MLAEERILLVFKHPLGNRSRNCNARLTLLSCLAAKAEELRFNSWRDVLQQLLLSLVKVQGLFILAIIQEARSL